MNAAFVSHERDRKQNEYHDKHNALFVLREFEDSKQALHIIAGQLVIGLAFGSATCVQYAICHVE